MIQTFFLEPTGSGRVYRWENEQHILVGECAREEFGKSVNGNYWTPIYRRIDTGEMTTWADAPVGATMMSEYGSMGGGQSLLVKCPGGHSWYVDSRASNCTRRDDTTHRCWIRHGEPRECRVTVDKNGNTCQAGGGSIIVPGWHGFLRNGQLVEC